MFYLAKSLQALGMVNLMVALTFGLTEVHGMAKEYVFLAIGCLMFLLGRLLEKRSRAG